jgi:hypothetical protein
LFTILYRCVGLCWSSNVIIYSSTKLLCVQEAIYADVSVPRALHALDPNVLRNIFLAIIAMHFVRWVVKILSYLCNYLHGKSTHPISPTPSYCLAASSSSY